MSAMHFVNIAAQLPARAREQPHRLAVLCPAGRDRAGRVRYTHFTYRQLDRESDRLAHGLAALGVARGMRTVLMVTPSLEFFALTFALFKLGAVLVLIDPGMGVRHLGRCLAEAEPTAFIGIPKAHLARVLFGWARATLRIHVTVGRKLLWSGWTLTQVAELGARSDAPVLAETTADETAAILFTSGSTGPPKGAVYSHRNFTAQVESLRDLYQIEPGEIDLATFPLFALFAPALGMTAVVPDMDATRPARVDPAKIFEAIDDFGVTNLFGSPALLHRVGLAGAARQHQLPTLRRVLSAGAPVPAAVIERFAGMLAPGVEIFTPYGATEALPVCSIGSDAILQETRHATAQGKGVCIGRPVASVRVAIIPIRDEPIGTWSETLPLAAGTIGEIAVQGPTVTRSYYNRPDATALAKIPEPDTGGFWHRMGDLGYLDEQGRVWFCGRKSQRVRTPRGELYTILCEGVFNAHPAVLRTALVGVGAPGQAQPVLCVELKPEAAQLERERVRQELLVLGAQQPHTAGIDKILFHPAFPVDIRHNSKIFREKLAVWAARRLA